VCRPPARYRWIDFEIAEVEIIKPDASVMAT